MAIYNSTAKGTSSDINIEVNARDLPAMTVTPPPEFKGPEGMWSPEDLFSASISSCYILTFKAIALFKKMEWSDLTVDVKAKLEKSKGGFIFTSVEIHPTVTILDSARADDFIKLLEDSKNACLVTRSMNCEFKVHPVVNT